MDAFGVPQPFPLLKAMNLVTNRPMTGPALASSTNAGRMLFVVPWQGRAVAGTSHSQQTCGPDDSGVSAEELLAFIDEVNQAFPAMKLTPDDVTLVHRGVVPAARNRRGELGLEGHFRIRDHAHDGFEGAVSLVGVKYTTGRGVASQAVDTVMRLLGRKAPGRTAELPLPGGEGPDVEALHEQLRREAPPTIDDQVARQLVETYGSEYRAILSLVAESAGSRSPRRARCPRHSGTGPPCSPPRDGRHADRRRRPPGPARSGGLPRARGGGRLRDGDGRGTRLEPGEGRTRRSGARGVLSACRHSRLTAAWRSGDLVGAPR